MLLVIFRPILEKNSCIHEKKIKSLIQIETSLYQSLKTVISVYVPWLLHNHLCTAASGLWLQYAPLLCETDVYSSEQQLLWFLYLEFRRQNVSTGCPNEGPKQQCYSIFHRCSKTKLANNHISETWSDWGQITKHKKNKTVPFLWHSCLEADSGNSFFLLSRFVCWSTTHYLFHVEALRWPFALTATSFSVWMVKVIMSFLLTDNPPVPPTTVHTMINHILYSVGMISE